MIEQEELRLRLAKYLDITPNDIGGGKSYGQFWNGSDEYPYKEVEEMFGIKNEC